MEAERSDRSDRAGELPDLLDATGENKDLLTGVRARRQGVHTPQLES